MTIKDNEGRWGRKGWSWDHKRKDNETTQRPADLGAVTPAYATFEAGWNAGFQEAQEPDHFPHQNRCEVRFKELLAVTPEQDQGEATTTGEAGKDLALSTGQPIKDNELDADRTKEIKRRRAKMYFPSGVATGEWADIDYLLKEVERLRQGGVALCAALEALADECTPQGRDLAGKALSATRMPRRVAVDQAREVLASASAQDTGDDSGTTTIPDNSPASSPDESCSPTPTESEEEVASKVVTAWSSLFMGKVANEATYANLIKAIAAALHTHSAALTAERTEMLGALERAQQARNQATRERDSLREALVKCAIPYEGLLMDTPSRKWIAPTIWKAIEEAVVAIRAALATPATTEDK